MKFYQIATPTTKQIFDAIISNEYTPLESIAPKAKQIKVLLQDYYCSNDILVTFDSVTNCGGAPIFFTCDASLYEIAAETNEDFYSLSEDDQDEIIELLGAYAQSYDSIFNID